MILSRGSSDRGVIAAATGERALSPRASALGYDLAPATRAKPGMQSICARRRAEALVNRAGERWQARKAADLRDRSALRLLL